MAGQKLVQRSIHHELGSFMVICVLLAGGTDGQSGDFSGDASGDGGGGGGNIFLKIAPPRCAARVDLVFIVQGSNSVGAQNYERLRLSLAHIISFLALDASAGFCVSVVVYGTQSQVEIPFICERDSAIAQAEMLRFPDEPGRFLGGAVSQMRSLFTTSSRDTAVSKVTVIISATPPTDQAETAREVSLARQEGILVFLIAVGSVVSSVFPGISADESKFFPTFTSLNDDPSSVQNGICDITDYCKVSSSPIVANPRDCSSFRSCTGFLPPLPTFRTIECPAGLWFRPSAQVCDFTLNFRCLTDPCMDIGFGSAPASFQCSAFWVCQDGRSVRAECCPQGQGYRDGEGCVADETCTDQCTAAAEKRRFTPLAANVGCDRSAIRGLPDWFMESGAMFTCRPGETFNPEICDCVSARQG